VKRALILATGTYADSRIAPLKSPVPDAERLRLLLIRDDVGPYDVTMLSDAGLMAQRVAIERYFQSAGPDDTLLLFVSGHGDKDADGDLYFLAQDTDRDLLSSTAIGAHFVSKQAARSRAKQKVLLIDTCYSGAFAKGHVFKSGSAAITAEDFGENGGRGTAIITAASSTQLASEAAAEGRMQSRFTRHLIEGIETGAADVNGTGNITLDELFDYVRTALRREGPGQEPKRLNAIDGDMVIARNPVPRAVPLAPALVKRIASRNWETRATACIALAEIVRNGDRQRGPALAALQTLGEDPDDRVKRRAQAELKELAEQDRKKMSFLGDLPSPGPRPDPVPDPKPDPIPDPGPRFDTATKIFIGVFAAMLLALLVMILRPDKDGEGTDGADTTGASTGSTSSASGGVATGTPPPVFGTGGEEFANYIAASTTYPMLVAACNKDFTYAAAASCFELGKAFENGEGETQDFAVATSLYEKACYRGHAEACAYASFRIRPDKPDRSYLLADAACKQDNARGCGYLGYNYENGVGATTNLYSARDYYNLGCTKGYSTACGERDRLNTAMGVTTP
jgi:TPR repeat protein